MHVGHAFVGLLQWLIKDPLVKPLEKPMKALDRRKLLKIKLKSLAAEARIIRREEQRTNGDLREEMHIHRVRDLRHESRATHLAYGFIRGVPYRVIEAKSTSDSTLPQDIREWAGLLIKVQNMAAKYGTNTGNVQTWLKEVPN